MTREELIKLNKKRRDIALSPIMKLISDTQRDAFKKVKVFKDTVPINLDDIDFSKDCIFIMQTDFMPILTYLGLIKLNKVNLQDDTATGLYSRIKTRYMISSPEDAKTAHMQWDYDMNDCPEAWFLQNYFNKDLVIWSIPNLIGLGTERDSNTSINSMNSLFEQRKIQGKLNWVFFQGTKSDLKDKIRIPSDAPVYIVRSDNINVIHNINRGGIL